MLNLDNVTLTCFVGLKKFFKPSLTAIEHSRRLCNFKKVKVFSCERFRHPFVECLYGRESSFYEYNQFMIEGINRYIDTDFILHIQYDGFVINPEAWADEFLNYDYIGALWPVDLEDDPQVTEDSRVGNGGFTLRSKKLLSLLQKDFKYDASLSKYWNKPYQEDALICRKWKKQLEEKGIKFAPPELAARFSIENEKQKEYENQYFSDFSTIKTFGFHNKRVIIKNE